MGQEKNQRRLLPQPSPEVMIVLGVGWWRGEDTCKMLFGDRMSRMDWMQKVEGWEEPRVKPGFWL